MFPVPPSSFPIPQNACIELHYCHNILCLSNPDYGTHPIVITYGYWKKARPLPFNHDYHGTPFGAKPVGAELMGAKM